MEKSGEEDDDKDEKDKGEGGGEEEDVGQNKEDMTNLLEDE